MSDLLASYRGRPAVVTGCSSGIGESVTRQLLTAGADVIGIDRVPPAFHLDHFVQTDLGDAKSIESSTEKLPAQVWSLFNCAGLSSGAADRQTVVRVNFIGYREFLEGAVPRLARGAAVVSTASIAGRDWLANVDRLRELVGTATFAEAVAWASENEAYLTERDAYRVAKEAMIVYTVGRAFGLCESGIRMNALAPGVTDTPFLAHSVKVLGEAILQPPRPMGRLATADEQAKILLFLNSDWASYLNGQIIWSDGGGVTRRDLDG